nr:glycosyltransferase [Actinomycetota bacterium]
ALCSSAELVQNPEDIDVLVRLGVARAKLRLLGNGIDLARFDRAAVPAEQVRRLRAEIGARPEDVVCGAVGRLVWEKGYAELFEAAAALRRRLPQARFVVVGPLDPDKADGLSDVDLARSRERAGITFLGLRHDVAELYAAMDLYVLASHREGYPRSAMEAAAMGLPMVATDIRGCRQVVDHGTTGLLVPRRDAPALADAVATLVADSDLRARMGRAGSQKAHRDFDQQRVIDITLETYRQLLASPRRRRAGTGPVSQ